LCDEIFNQPDKRNWEGLIFIFSLCFEKYICKNKIIAMQVFFANKTEGELAFFDENESKHCLQVLRHKMGDEISFMDGSGHLMKGKIVEAGKKTMLASIEETAEIPGRNYQLDVAIAPPKSIDRFEFFLEKATEIGIDNIFPIFTEHSERTKLRIDRCEKVLLAATKQCMTPNLPQIHEPVKFTAFLKENKNYDTRFIGYCGENDLPLLAKEIKPKTKSLMLIGPEGDFSPKEFEEAVKQGFKGVSLGTTRLRTETAAILVTASFSVVNGMNR
jgi:16S rRNA (uracil1498-N3)-methyltransferase